MGVELGPFEIESHFATGGMGEVWHGRHVEQDVPVAIKVITGPNALVSEYKAEFRREVQAVARLNHPNVVQVFDYGSLPDGVASLDGDLTPGAPYLIMEYASRGSLADQLEPLNWRDVKNILMSVLGGLAHAHARGVIHRDIKPGNVLLGSHDESPPRIILTDFGVAHATDSNTRTDAVELTGRSTEEATGTPRYMAPEQFMGKWRDYGPWTDLYAVGIMAYEMVTGELPFQGDTFMVLAMDHVNEEFPELEPRIDVPDGFEAWVRRLTLKQHFERYHSAANAAWALAGLDDSEILYGELSALTEEDDDEYYESTDVLPTRIDFAPPEAIRIFTMSRRADTDTAYEDVPPLPRTWNEAEPPESKLSLVGAGLGLFGLRTIPVVDREEERTRLWEIFTEVHGGRADRAVVVRGLTGVGKSRLAEWLCRLVEEIGAANVFRAAHGSVAGPMHGLDWTMTTQFRCAGLSEDDLEERVKGVLARHDLDDEFRVRALTEMMRIDLKNADESADRGPSTMQPEQRHPLIRSVLEATTPDRPLVGWFEDVHWEKDTIEFVRHCLENPSDDIHPEFFILTVRDEALREREEEREALDALLALDEVVEMSVDGLEIEHLTALVQEQLYLPTDLATDLARRAAGSPLFAIQLVEDWVKRGVLEVEDGGFVVRHGVSADVPSDAVSLWESRLDYLLRQLTSDAVAEDDAHEPLTAKEASTAVELAAALGQDVDVEEWKHACEMASVPATPAVVDLMSRLRLATAQDHGFSFVNAQLWELVCDASRDAGRWERQNMICARMLTTRYRRDHPGLALRVGRHFLEGNSAMLAAMALEEALRRAEFESDQRETLEIAELLEQCYHEMEVDEDDVRWVEPWTRRGISLFHSEDPEVSAEGFALLERAEEIARDAVVDDERLAEIVRTRAWAAIHSGDLDALDAGIERAREALELAAGNTALEAQCHRTMGHLLLSRGRIEEAVFHLERTIELEPYAVASIYARQQLGRAALERGDLELARRRLAGALEFAAECGVPLAEAQIHETLGFVADAREDYPAAERHHRESLRIREAVSFDSTLPSKSREYLARAVLALGRYDDVDAIASTVHAHLDAGGRGFYSHLTDVLLAVAAGKGEWERFDELLDDAVTFDDFAPNHLHVKALNAAARLAARAGRSGRARTVWQQTLGAIERWDASFPEWTTRIRRSLDGLSGGDSAGSPEPERVYEADATVIEPDPDPLADVPSIATDVLEPLDVPPLGPVTSVVDEAEVDDDVVRDFEELDALAISTGDRSNVTSEEVRPDQETEAVEEGAD